MTPGLVDTSQPESATASALKELVGPKEVFIGGPQAYSKTGEEQGTKKHPAAKHPKYLPIWDPETKPVAPKHIQNFFPTDNFVRYLPLEPFTHYEHGKDADPSFKDLLGDAASVADITASTGTEVHGVQLSSLTKEGKDQLAMFVARRKVVGKFVH